jgi:NADPH:quinone reductase-like Zn-dependent oxidoreductase
VEVHAAASTFAELAWQETWTRDGTDRTPTIPCHESSGRVAQICSAVTEFAILSVGERVLVHGGAGGVGGYVAEMAVAAGAHVTATARSVSLRFIFVQYGYRRAGLKQYELPMRVRSHEIPAENCDRTDWQCGRPFFGGRMWRRR